MSTQRSHSAALAALRSRSRSASPPAATTTTTAASAASRRPPSDDGRQRAAIANNPDNAKITLTIGSKNFTEQKVLGEIYAQGLRGRRLQGQEGAQPRRREDAR